MFNKLIAKEGFWFCVIKGRWLENYLNEKEAFPLPWLLLFSCKLIFCWCSYCRLLDSFGCLLSSKITWKMFPFAVKGTLSCPSYLHTQQSEKNDWVKTESESTVSCGFYEFRICILDFKSVYEKQRSWFTKRMLSYLRFLAFYVVNILISNIRIHGWELLINTVLQWNKVLEVKSCASAFTCTWTFSSM